MRLICLVMHLVFSKILKYALQTFLRFDSNVPPQIQNSLLFMVHIHMIYTGFTHFCREISLVVITRFGRHFLAKIWWGEALKHFRGPGMDHLQGDLCTPGVTPHLQE